MPQSFTCLHYHLIFSTKNRMPTITADLQGRLYEYLGGILRAEKAFSCVPEVCRTTFTSCAR
jgi:hypothetical protein